MCKKTENKYTLNIKLQIYREKVISATHCLLKEEKTLDQFKRMVFDSLTLDLKWLKKGQKNELSLYVGEVVEEYFLRYHGVGVKKHAGKKKQSQSKQRKSKIRSTR